MVKTAVFPSDNFILYLIMFGAKLKKMIETLDSIIFLAEVKR